MPRIKRYGALWFLLANERALWEVTATRMATVGVVRFVDAALSPAVADTPG